jgi:hypothetical protein
VRRFARCCGLASTTASPTDSLTSYFAKLEQAKLIDTATGNVATLRKELASAEAMLGGGAHAEAAVALYSIVVSPRYEALKDFVEFQNAEYDLGVALSQVAAYGAAQDAFGRVLKRGSAASYWAPAHRRVVDIAIETRDHDKVLAMLAATDKNGDVIPPSAAGERSYLRGRAQYERKDFVKADAELANVSNKSRLYSSALYLRGVIAAQNGKYRRSAEAMCEVAGMGDASRISFVVDQRYFTLKDLARLGLGRLAHEQGKYDDAYYHYFQIPDDSTYLAEALFEAAWSMYQKRELATARDLTREFLAAFPNSSLWPEATLLAGYVELADCKFNDSQKLYDNLAARLTPLVAELERIRQDPGQTLALLDRALGTWRTAKQQGDSQAIKLAATKTASLEEQVVGLLQIDPLFVRLSDSVNGMNAAAGLAPGTAKAWQDLRSQLGKTAVATTSTGAVTANGKDDAQQNAAQAYALVGEVRALRDQAEQQQARMRDQRSPASDQSQLRTLVNKLAALEQKSAATADELAREAAAFAATGSDTIATMVTKDVAHAQQLQSQARALRSNMAKAAEARAMTSIERVYKDTKRVLDKAKLGKIDAVIGQKRKLDIDVQDLAAGRFPAELIGQMWNAGLIGDDEEIWPLQGDFWADEYEGWR